MYDYKHLWECQNRINEANEKRFAHIINALENAAECLKDHEKRMKEMENEIEKLKCRLSKYEKGTHW